MSSTVATATDSTEVERASLRTDVSLAGSILSRAWPLENFIAVNPLGALEGMEFSAAVKQAGTALGARGTLNEEAFRAFHSEGRILDDDLLEALESRHSNLLSGPRIELGGTWFGSAEVLLCDLLNGTPAPPPVRTDTMPSERIHPQVAETVDEQTFKWCSAFLDEDNAGWQMPGREQGFYTAWADLAPRDRSLPPAVRETLRRLPESADQALLEALERMGIIRSQRQTFLRGHLTRMPGWVAHIRWREERSDSIDLLAYLAMRTTYESSLIEAISTKAEPVASHEQTTLNSYVESDDARAVRVAEELTNERPASHAELAVASRLLSGVPVEDRAFLWLEAYESGYRNKLLSRLERPTRQAEIRPDAQLVFCIDVRSEGIRRHLENAGAYETLGFAGFFAVAIRFQKLAGGRPTALCPVLLEPRNQVSEVAAAGAEQAACREIAGHDRIAGAEDSFHSAESHLASPFVLAETTGWARGPLAAARTLFARNYSKLRGRLKDLTARPAPTVIDVESGFSLEERLLFAEVTLSMIGLNQGFARLVVLCGHGSTTDNNPYKSALDCGACGGNAGSPNARTAAAILNGTELRVALAARGIEIPAETWFVAALHDTTTDRVTLLDRHLVPETHREELLELDQDLDRASAGLSLERCGAMPGATGIATPERAARHVEGRAGDWAEVFPEWGLAGNAAFIIGPRSMTRGLDLGRRAFLHSYDAEIDTEGEGLETILTAPVVVAQWISCQYYFSTVDPVAFGSGSKVIHNVVGGFGVLAGYGGDLKLGLPWQSVADGDRLIHEPMRLLVVAQAPLDRIDSIVGRNPLLQDLFGNGWLALAARASEEEPWMRHTDRGWQPWTRTEKRND